MHRPPFNYSTSSPKRKAGFLSTDTLLDSTGQTIFKQCKTVPQCFKDSFMHHGVEHTRQVYIEQGAIASASPAFMREWVPGDASKCGIFGYWVADASEVTANIMCPGTTTSSHYCCAVDFAVAPLFYLFYTYPEVFSGLEATCNRPFSFSYGGTIDASYPIFSKAAILAKIKQIGR